MKFSPIPFLVLAVSIAVPAMGYAQYDSTRNRDISEKPAAAKSAPAKTHKAAGTVTKVDTASSKVTIAHGPVETLKWSAMTMTFVVKDKALLGMFSSGRKVEFEFVQQGRDYVIVSAK
ncbi:MAG TPA: copper-binding protein [Burkholderiales bacterium]